MDSHRSSKEQAILTSVAESIGSTLGTIAAKAESVQKAFTRKTAAAPRVRRAAKSTGKKRGSARKKATGAKARRAKRK